MSEVCQRPDVWDQFGGVNQVSNEGKGQEEEGIVSLWGW